MKKICLFLSILLLITGCQMKYEIKIDEAGVIDETVRFLIPNEDLKKNGTTPEEYVENNLYAYDSIEGMDLYKKDYQLGSDLVDMNYTKQYTSLDQFESSILLRELFTLVNKVQNGNVMRLQMTGFREDKLFSNEIGSNMVLNQVAIEITLSNPVTHSNADKVDKINNRYTWYINDDNSLNELVLEYDTKTQYRPSIFDYLVHYWYFIFLGLLLFGIMVFGYRLYQKNQENNQI